MLIPEFSPLGLRAVITYARGWRNKTVILFFRLECSDAAKKGENFIGRVYRFILTDADDPDKRLDLVVKLPPADEIFRRAVQVDECFRVEAHMYGKVLPALADCYKKRNLIPKDAVFPSTVR